MLITEFIEKFQDVYEYDYDADEEYLSKQIRLLYNKQKNVMLESVFVCENDDGNFSIYKEFIYEDYDSPIKSLEAQKAELLFLQYLGKNSAEKPDSCFEDSMGCPFCSINIGYFGIIFSWDIFLSRLAEIENACDNYLETGIDIEYCAEMFPNEYDCYLEEQKKAFKELHDSNATFNYKQIHESCYFNKSSKTLSENDLIYINDGNTVILGVGEESLQKIGFSHIKQKEKLIGQYLGLKYFFGKSSNLTICANISYVEEINTIFEKLSYDYDYKPSLYTNSANALLIVFSELWAVIGLLRNDNLELYMEEEKKLLNNLLASFREITPTGLWQKTYDFSRLDATLFEKMCRDLLIDMNFKNVVIRGDTKAPDGGIDIEADEEYKTLFDTEIRHWIFQCKHTKNQIGRKDLSESEHLLEEFHADCYGVFYSHIFTPDTLDRIKTLNKKFKIGYWDKNSIEVLLNQYSETSERYFVL